MPKTATDPRELIRRAEKDLSERFDEVEQTALENQRKVLNAFRAQRLTEEYFVERTGYGRNDPGREAVDAIFATVFGAQSAAVRMQLVSGTHAIAAALCGCVQHGDRIAGLTGDPYDTLHDVIGLTEPIESGSLKAMGVDYIQTFVDPQGKTDEQIVSHLRDFIQPPTTLAYLQKSRGYSFDRRTFSNEDIRRISGAVKQINPECTVFVDNCYGEFVETQEPLSVGADLIAGSLIKNPGGGLAIGGGYIAGNSNLVDRALNRVTSPGIGGHLGLTFNQNRLVLQGLFLAPSVVSQALKGAMLFAHVLSQLGLVVKPAPLERRFDIIQAIEFGTPERLVNFCRAIQMWSPVNAHVVPEPAAMPGYPDPVIMAAGTFVEGSTIELSADGPLRPPYAAFLQGGLTYLHVKCALEEALSLSASGELAFT
jgi:cystathionine beta-lyase family protein involved in aluminum resistance